MKALFAEAIKKKVSDYKQKDINVLLEIISECKSSLKIINLAENDIRFESESYDQNSPFANHFGFIDELEKLFTSDPYSPLLSIDLRGTCLV